MYTIELVGQKFRYMVGSGSVGILPPSRHKHIATLRTVKTAWTGGVQVEGERSGMHDRILTVEEIASYILKNWDAIVK